MATYRVKSYGALCSLEEFSINDIPADEEDFVDKYDHSPDTAEDYGCGDMKADVIPATEEVRRKYSITEEEYLKIAEEVAEQVSFGNCGWCV